MSPDSDLERVVFRWGCVALFLALSAFLAHACWTGGPAALAQLASSAALSLFVIGKFVIFAGLQQGAPSIWSLAELVFLLDMIFAFALAGGIRGLERTRWLGSWLRRGRERALEVLREYPRLRRMAFFGVVAFVLLPVAGTGAITGSFVARILGLSRVAGIGAIALASAWTSLVFALVADFLGERGKDLLKNPLLVGLGIVLLTLIGLALGRRFLGKLRT